MPGSRSIGSGTSSAILRDAASACSLRPIMLAAKARKS